MKLLSYLKISLCCLPLALISCKGSDEPASCQGEECDKSEEEPNADLCNADADCSDGLFCTGKETCDPENEDADKNGCLEGTLPTCDDEIECTIDTCDVNTDHCKWQAPDEDGDGHKDASCFDGDDEPLGDDCDDQNEDRYPGNLEVCDSENVDEDCNPNTFGQLDADGDGSISDVCCNGDNCGDDCNDEDLAIRPLQPEFCDDKDNNCDGEIDNDTREVNWYTDLDGDGFGDLNGDITISCYEIVGKSVSSNDCEDSNPEQHRATPEICGDDIDNNCNDVIDEGPNCAIPEGRPVDGTSTGGTSGEDGAGGSNNGAGGSNNGAGGSDDGAGGSDDGAGGSDNGTGGSSGGAGTGGAGTGGAGTGGPGDYVCSANFPSWGVASQVLSACEPSTGDGGVEVKVTDGVTLSVSWTEVAPAVAVRAENSWSVTDAQVSIQLEDSVDETEVIALFVATNGDEIPVASTIEGKTITIPVTAEGTYTVVTLTPGPLPNCSTSILSGNQTISSAAQMADLLGISYIVGNLTITADDLTNLDSLACLRTITGNLFINGANALTDSTGLSGVVEVGGYVRMDDNDSLETLSLPSLVLVGTYVSINSNDDLALADLGALVRINGRFDFLTNGGNATTTTFDFGSVAEVKGNVTIQSNGRLTNLNGLSSLRKIDGNLYIYRNNFLEDADGLAQLRQLQGYLYVYDNDSLESFLTPRLATVGTYVTITANDALSAVDLRAVGEITGNLTINTNGEDAGTTTIDFSSLTHVGGALSIQSNPRLVNLDGFVQVSRIDGSATVHSNVVLQSAEGLDGITEIGGLLKVTSNAALEAFRAPLLASLGGTLTISSNAQLAAVDLRALDEVDALTINTNGANALRTTLDFSSLELVQGNFSLQTNPGVETLDSFSELTRVDGYLYLNTNSSLQDADGFSSLVEVGSYVSIYNNDALVSFSAPLLASIGTYLSISNNDDLSLVEMSALDALSSYLSITNNGSASTLTTLAFDELVQIGGRFALTSNPRLEDLDGFAKLTRIDDYLNIGSNTNLESIEGLDGLILVDGNLTLSNNDALLALPCPLLDDIGGNISITGNDDLELVELPLLEEVNGHLTITTNGSGASLTTLNFPALLTINNYLTIQSNAHLVDLDTFSNLDRINEALTISSNQALVDIDGLAGLTEVGAALSVSSNSSLSNLSLPLLETIGTNATVSNNQDLVNIDFGELETLPGNLSVTSNTDLASLGLASLGSVTGSFTFRSNGSNATSTTLNVGVLAAIGGTLTIQSNPNLPDIDNFSSLTNIDGALSVSTNAALANLSGFSQLTTVGTTFSLSNNDDLIAAILPALDTLGGNLTITNNDNLPTCHATVIRDNLVGWSETASISGNSTDTCTP